MKTITVIFLSLAIALHIVIGVIYTLAGLPTFEERAMAGIYLILLILITRL